MYMYMYIHTYCKCDYNIYKYSVHMGCIHVPKCDSSGHRVIAVNDREDSTQKFIDTGYLGDVLFT